MTQSQSNLQHPNSAQKAQQVAPDAIMAQENCQRESSDKHRFNLIIDEFCSDSSSLNLLTHRIEDVGQPFLNRSDLNSTDYADSLMEAILLAAEESVEYHVKR